MDRSLGSLTPLSTLFRFLSRLRLDLMRDRDESADMSQTAPTDAKRPRIGEGSVDMDVQMQ